MHFRRAFITLLCMLALSACRGRTPEPADSGMPVAGARDAVTITLSLLKTSIPTTRSAALLSIYANMLLAGGLDVPVFAAKAGVEAQMKLNGPLTTENLDDLYRLLEEFSAALHVDVPDLLNRSDNRAQTLDTYATGLQNITDRSKRRRDDLNDQIKDLKTRQQKQRKAVSSLDKEAKNAVKAKDFATAQSKQSALSDAQEKMTSLELQIKELSGLADVLNELIGIASQRIAALEGNRDVLIAGLQVSDLPGVEDLGLIEGRVRGRSRKGFSPFGGL